MSRTRECDCAGCTRLRPGRREWRKKPRQAGRTAAAHAGGIQIALNALEVSAQLGGGLIAEVAFLFERLANDLFESGLEWLGLTLETGGGIRFKMASKTTPLLLP